MDDKEILCFLETINDDKGHETRDENTMDILDELLELGFVNVYKFGISSTEKNYWYEITDKGKSFIRKRKMKKNNNKKVFIVHGHNEVERLKVELFIREIGLEPVVLHKQTSGGLTIIEKLEEYTDVRFAIVLYTYCDEGKTKGENELNPRARQNVIFEHGYLTSKLGRGNVCVLVEDLDGKIEIEKPGDNSGVVYIKIDKNDGWMSKLRDEIKHAGIEI